MENYSSISIVIPCYNEEEVIQETIRQLEAFASQAAPLKTEFVFVDDGSSDRTFEQLKEFAGRNVNVRVIRFARNFGHQIAVTAGIDMTSGDAVVVIDADLQDPLSLIHEMIEKWKAGYDVVYGTRTEREGETFFKLATSRLFYRLMNRMSDIAIPLDAGDFRLMSRKIVDVLKVMPERDRFIRGMVSWVGFKQISIPYKRAPRFAGVSKYPLRKMLHFAMNGFLSFSYKPLQFAIGLGMFASFLSLIGIVYSVYSRLFLDTWVKGWTALMTAILFLGGVQLLCVGVLGEYVGRIYNEIKRRPLYVVKDSLGFDQQPETARIPNQFLK